MFSSLFRTRAKLAVAGMAGFFAHEVHSEVSNGKQTYEAIQSFPYSERNPQASVLESSAREWLLFGRQSPGYASKEADVSDLKKRIASSKLLITQLGAAVANENDFELLPGSDFVISRVDVKDNNLVVKPEQMFNTAARDLVDEQSYAIYFAKKRGFAEWCQQSPLYHSSIALRIPSQDRPIADHEVVLSGKEIKEIFEKADRKICEEQHCTMVQSNCYSFTMVALSEALMRISKSDRPEALKRRGMEVLAQTIKDHSTDNFGVGVLNNALVRHEILRVRHALDDQGLLQAVKAAGNARNP